MSSSKKKTAMEELYPEHDNTPQIKNTLEEPA
jgi:hypothetical protein